MTRLKMLLREAGRGNVISERINVPNICNSAWLSYNDTWKNSIEYDH